MTNAIKCPICGSDASKALLGVFPVKLCGDEHCGCAWGFWATPAFWLYDNLTPNDGGWWLVAYTGSYVGALVAMMRGEVDQ